MRCISIILLASCLLVLECAHLLRAQATAKGWVINTETGQPLEDAHVYLSGTKIGTNTNKNGQYLLQEVPVGSHRVVVSIIGYETRITNVVIGPEETREMNFELKPAIYQLPEIYVGDLDEEWKENLERFINNFIGETAWADSVKILNPEVLRFDKNWWGRLTAEALAPLKIENRGLGYYITYHLKEFEHTGTRTRWDGEPFFTEMTPADSAQAAYWEHNRKDAFYGSLRHFLLALQADRIKEEGFILYNIRRRGFRFLSDKRSQTSADRLIQDTKENYLHHLNFFGRLEIIYTKESEDWQYVRWHRERRRPADVQTSYLELNEHPVTVDADGEFVQPYGATQFGYYAYIRLASLTPREYRPEDYSISDKR